jgi:hypothetical protein
VIKPPSGSEGKRLVGFEEFEANRAVPPLEAVIVRQAVEEHRRQLKPRLHPPGHLLPEGPIPGQHA